MTRKCLFLLAAVCLCANTVQAQFAATLKMSKKTHLVGESVIVTVQLTNHTGQEQIFQNDGRFQWLSFDVKTSSGKPVNIKAQSSFGPMKIGPGQTLAREVDLSEHFQLSAPGNFSVSATIQPPNSNLEGSSTNRLFFNQNSGRTYWTQKVGNKNNSREYRLIHFKGDNSNQIYAQVQDGRTGQNVSTFRLGDILMMRNPLTTVDGNQNMHVLFLTTPVMWLYYIIDTDGHIINRQIHQRGAIGDPQLITLADGTVQVGNSNLIDLEAIAKSRAQIHKITDRPAGVDEF